MKIDFPSSIAEDLRDTVLANWLTFLRHMQIIEKKTVKKGVFKHIFEKF